MIAQSVAEILTDHVKLSVEGIDRVYRRGSRSDRVEIEFRGMDILGTWPIATAA